MCTIYRDGVIAESTDHNWFTRFRSGNIDLEVGEFSSRPTDSPINMFIRNTSGLTHNIRHHRNSPHILYEHCKVRHLKTLVQMILF